MAEFMQYHRGKETDQEINDECDHRNGLGQEYRQFLFELLERFEIRFDELQTFARIQD